MTKADIVKRIAKSKNIVGDIKKSTKEGKKFMITLPDGYIVHFGSSSNEDII